MPGTLRATMTAAARRVRAYFAPVNRATSAPTVFNLGRDGSFPLDAPPPGWLDLGSIENFSRRPGTRIQAARSGPSGGIASQFRSQLEARLGFDFRDWGKLQMALAGGSEHFNVLAADVSSDPSGQTPFAAAPLESGSSATELVLDPAVLVGFAAGDPVAVDLDYAGETGYVGAGLPGAFVRDSADIGGDAGFIRRVTFNVGRVASKTGTALVLAQPLIAGVPPAGAKAQKVAGFADREGGTFFQEWSGLFVVPEELGGRVVFYYPRLQVAAPAQEQVTDLEPPLRALSLHTELTALPSHDTLDGQPVVCYRAFFPATSAALY